MLRSSRTIKMWAVRVSRQLQVRSGLNATAIRRYTNPLVDDKAVDDSQAFNKDLKGKVEDVRTATANRAKAAGERASPDHLAEKTEEAVGSAQRQASHAKDNVKDAADTVKDKAQSYAQAAKDKAADATESVRHNAAEAAETAKHKTAQATHTAQEEGRGVYEKVKEYAEEAKEKIEKTAQSIKETVVGK
eukprot:jgi/Chlat1/6435/Chrsp45S00464